MKLNWMVTVGFALLMAPCAEALAVDKPRGPSDFKYRSLVRRLKPGEDLRVTTESVRFPLRLRLAGASNDGLCGAIHHDGPEGPQAAALSDSVTVHWSEIRRLDVRGRATGTGCAVGLLVGALGGIAAGVALSHMSLGGLDSSPPTADETTSAALYCGAIGAVGGALVGAVIGSAIPTWDAVYIQR